MSETYTPGSVGDSGTVVSFARREEDKMKPKFELVFVGAGNVRAYRIPRYRRMHQTLDSARATARQVWEQMSDSNLPTACHTPIVYGPGCGKDGTSVAPW